MLILKPNFASYRTFFLFFIVIVCVLGSTDYYYYKNGIETDIGKAFILLFNLFCLRMWFYQIIDLILTKKIYIRNDDIILECLCFKFRLNPERSIMKVEDMNFVSYEDYVKYSTVNIIRNPENFWDKLFKNRIKLYKVDCFFLKQAQEATQKITEKFGIPFIDDYSFDREGTSFFDLN